MRKFTLIFFTLLSLHACADSGKSKPEGAPMINTKAEIFGDKPIYKLRIDSYKVPILARVNGTEVFGGAAGSHTEVTVNPYIASKGNRLSMMIADPKKLSPEARASIKLYVYAEGKRFILNRIEIDLSKRDIVNGSTPAGRYGYDTDKGLYPDPNGKIEVGKTTFERFNIFRGGPIDGINVVQPFSLPTPFPRWKFLDSPDIIDFNYDYHTEKEYEDLKNTPKIKALYALDAKIRDALRAKDPERIIDLFKERFEEDAYAFYDTPQALRQELLNSFKEKINNPDYKMIEEKPEDLYFIIEENRKLAKMKRIQFYNKKTKIYSKYTIMYRLNKKGEWVITQ